MSWWSADAERGRHDRERVARARRGSAARARLTSSSPMAAAVTARCRWRAHRAGEPAVRLMAKPRRLQSAAITARGHASSATATRGCALRCARALPRGLVSACSRRSSARTRIRWWWRWTRKDGFQKAVAWLPTHRSGRAARPTAAAGASASSTRSHAAFRMSTFRQTEATTKASAPTRTRSSIVGNEASAPRSISTPRSGSAIRRDRPAVGLARQYFAYGRGRSRTVRRHRVDAVAATGIAAPCSSPWFSPSR